MKPEKIRTTIDIPVPLYQMLKERAAAQGCSARELILRGMEKVLLNPRKPARRISLTLMSGSHLLRVSCSAALLS